MAGSPAWKVYNNDNGEYVAACKYAEDAAAVVANLPTGSTIRWGHKKTNTVWMEGVDGNAGDSFDHVAEVCSSRAKHWSASRRYS